MFAWIKTHPLYDVLLAIGLFIVFYLVARGSSGSSGGGGGGGGVTYVQSGPSDAVQTAQLAASAQQSHDQASLSALATQTQAELSLGQSAVAEKAIEATLGAGVANRQIEGQVALGQFGAQVSQNIAEAQAEAQVQMNADAIAGQVAVAGYSAQTQIQTNKENNATQRAIAAANLAGFEYQIDGSVKMNDSNNAAVVARDQIAADTTTALGGYQRDVNLAGIGAQENVNLAGIQAGVTTAGYQQNVDLAQIAAGVTTAGYAKDVSIANTNAASAAYSQYLDVAGGLATQQESDQYNESQYQTSSWMNYVTQLTQLKAYGKDISGLPGTGVTPQQLSAAQPGNTSAAQISAWGSFLGGVAKAATAFV
jgi:hypothetical protein